MKRSSKSVVLWFLLLALLAACGGSEDDPQPQADYFLRFKVDNVQKEFRANMENQLMSMTYNADASVHVGAALLLGNGSDGTRNFISLSILNEEPFATGVTYQMQDLISYGGVPIVRIQFTYSDEAGDVYNAVLVQRSDLPMRMTDDVSLRFSSITDNQVGGSFDATVLGPVSSGAGRANNELKITEGQFRLKLHRAAP